MQSLSIQLIDRLQIILAVIKFNKSIYENYKKTFKNELFIYINVNRNQMSFNIKNHNQINK